MALRFIRLVSFRANFELTRAIGIEHDGLLRGRLPSGRHAPCRPHHSRNSIHVFSNRVRFHLQRHSDHHAHPVRRHQSLRHFENLPELPNGYMGVFLVAYLPPLGFHLMDRRLIRAVGGDASRIHFQAGQRDALMRRHGLQPQAA